MANQSRALFGFVVRRNELEHRFDPQYYHSDRRKALKTLSKSRFPICNLVRLVTFRKEKVNPQQYPDRKFTYVSLANIRPHTGEIIGETTVNGENVLSQCNVFRKGDILFSKLRPYLNKVHLAQDEMENGICSTEFIVLKPRIDVNKVYLRAYLSSSFVLNQTKHMMTGYTLPRLSQADIESIKVPLPPLEIQESLAKVIERIYEERNQKLKEAGELPVGVNDYVLRMLEIDLEPIRFRASFLVRFKDLQESKRYDPQYYRPSATRVLDALKEARWDTKTIGELTSKIINGLDCRKYAAKGTPYIRVENVRENEIDLERVKFVELKHDRIPSRMRLKEGDLLLTRKGSYGICAVVTKEHEKCTISSEIIKITLKPGINPYYIAVFMNSDLGKMQFRRLAVGAIMPGINHGALKSLKVLIPPRRVQDEIENQTKERIGLASRLKQEAKNLEGKVELEIEAIILSKGQVSEN